MSNEAGREIVKRLRQKVPLRSSHAHEVLAAYFGFQSHIAMKAASPDQYRYGDVETVRYRLSKLYNFNIDLSAEELCDMIKSIIENMANE